MTMAILERPGRWGLVLGAGHASAERLRDDDAADRLKPAHTDGSSGFQSSLVDALERASAVGDC